MQQGTVRGEAAERNSCYLRRRSQRIDNGTDRNTGGTVGRKAIDAGRNRWKGDRGEPVLLAELDRAAIAGGKQIILTKRAAIPHRPNRVDHVSGGEPIALGDLGVAGLATVEHPALRNKVRPRRTMDGAIDASPAEQRGIGGVDDGVNAHGGNVGNDDFEPRLTDLTRRYAQAEAAALRVTPLSANICCNSPAWNISRMISQPPTNSPLT